ncbi:uncharacterized protein BP5553_04162 [Venustampulla echinocandica]|uniref:Uncharacterized protein n=1 Tax=Venustampulla echinocandica TaxID=2656787 RepID=A0A370TWB8_9HELO|nr:uncharacterized protein BP5553_04162 [Venustampulla echinocandica]RDL39822.1 hypothetical protein BP5553_04162 [Venustampulla echinocandica]
MTSSMPIGGAGAVNRSECSDDEGYDLPPLDYARSKGLCRDYLTDSMAVVHTGELQARVGRHLTDDPHLPQLDLGLSPCVNERLVLSQDGARFLQLVKQEESFEVIDSLVLPLLGNRDVKSSKIELPLLKSDHKTDFKEFARREDFEIRFKDVRLPLEIVDEENGEGLSFPSKYWQLEQHFRHDLEMEKIEVSKDAVAYLQTTIKDLWTQADEAELLDREQTCKRTKALEPVTPPLSPVSSASQPCEPSSSSPTYQLPVLSDPESLSKEDLKNIEDYIFEQDIPTPIRLFMQSDQQNNSSADPYSAVATVKLADIYPPAGFMDHSTPPSVKSERAKREDLKVDELLTPLKPTTVVEKNVRFSEGVEQMLLNPMPTDDSEQYDKFFIEATFSKYYEYAMQQVEQEKLIEADTTARVKERIMNFSAPDPPWKKFQEANGPVHLLSLQKEMIKSVIGPKQEVWKRPGRKQLELRWNPFPHDLAKVALEESHEVDNHVWDVFVSPKDKQETDSSDLTWKPPGLRIVKINDEDDEDIELGEFASDQQQDMSFLVRKRKKELEQEDLDQENPKRSQFQTQLQPQNKEPQVTLQAKRSTLHLAGPMPSLAKGQCNIEPSPTLLLGGEFSAGNLLENYRQLHGVKKLKLADSSYFSSKVRKESAAQPEPAQAISAAPQDELQLPINHSPIQQPRQFPAPPLKASTTPINILVSSTLLKHRALIRNLESLLPSLTIIERDFTAHNTTAWMPGSVTRSPKSSPLDSEADLIVSPSTGVILTTLQKVKQVPLPGSKTKTAIRDRLEKASVRYEDLIVLVTEGRNDETTNGLDENDCIALSEFIGFASGLTTTVIVHLVVGGEETLAKWLACTIMRHRLGKAEADLLTEETHWELFLRRAGMNAFAAQVIVAGLKSPEGVDERSPTEASQFGMAAFVEMGRERRLKMFGGLCGRGLVERVSDVIDRSWE